MIIVATGNTFIAGDASAMEVRRHSSTGADIERHKRLTMAGPANRDRTVDQKRIDDMPYPTHFPAYNRFVAHEIGADDIVGVWRDAMVRATVERRPSR